MCVRNSGEVKKYVGRARREWAGNITATVPNSRTDRQIKATLAGRPNGNGVNFYFCADQSRVCALQSAFLVLLCVGVVVGCVLPRTPQISANPQCCLAFFPLLCSSCFLLCLSLSLSGVETQSDKPLPHSYASQPNRFCLGNLAIASTNQDSSWSTPTFLQT